MISLMVFFHSLTHLAISIQVIAYSNSNIKLLEPLGGDPITKTNLNYPDKLSIAPQAYWIWSGPGDTTNCSQ